MSNKPVRTGITEYDEGLPILIKTLREHLSDYGVSRLLNAKVIPIEKGDRLVVVADTCVGDGMAVDLEEIIAWVRENKPELLECTQSTE